MSERAAGPDPGLLADVARAARASGAAAWLVGGAVRDLLLGRAAVDLDVALEGPRRAADGTVSALASRPGWSCGMRHAAFGTATLRAPTGERVDVAVTREERYPRPGALPVVSPGAPIERDLARRDFTIHAMALPLGPHGIDGPRLDPFGGERDLRDRLVRLLHEGSLEDDPTRAFRAARYAARLGFGLDAGFVPATARAVASGAFAQISGDRLRRALLEVLSEENRGVALTLLQGLGVPGAVVAGWEWNRAIVRALAGVEDLDDAWAAILAPSPASVRKGVATRLSFSRALRRRTGCPA